MARKKKFKKGTLVKLKYSIYDWNIRELLNKGTMGVVQSYKLKYYNDVYYKIKTFDGNVYDILGSCLRMIRRKK